MKSRWGAYAIAAVVWAIGFVPAVLLLLWLDMIEPTVPDIFRAVVILAVIVALFGLLQRWIARMLAGSDTNGAPQP